MKDAVGLGDPEGLGVLVREAVCVSLGVEDTLEVDEPDREPLALRVPETLDDPDTDGLSVCEAEIDADWLADCVGVMLLLVVPLTVEDGVPVDVRVDVGVSVSVMLGVRV